jgi:hypothetical protein
LITFGIVAIASVVNAQGYDRQALAGWSLGVNPDKVVHAINCGSPDDFTDFTGVTYKAVSLVFLTANP